MGDRLTCTNQRNPSIMSSPQDTSFSRRGFIHSTVVGTAGLAVGTQAAHAEKPVGQPVQVDRRKLGRIGTDVSILGLGLGSAFTKPHEKDHEAGQALLEKALGFGVNYWDTSRGYGDSEEIIGPVVEKNRDRIFLVTKSEGRGYDSFMRDVETSMKNLRTDHLDLLHIWNLREKDAGPEKVKEVEKGAYQAVRKLIDEKVVKNFGVTGHTRAAILIDYIERLNPDAVLTIFPCTRPDGGRYEDELLPLARKKNMGVIAMKTVRQARNADLKGTDLIRYALSLDGVHTAIVGLDTLAHLGENAQMASAFKPLKKKEMAALSEDAVRCLAGEVAPWDRPGYRDGQWA